MQLETIIIPQSYHSHPHTLRSKQKRKFQGADRLETRSLGSEHRRRETSLHTSPAVYVLGRNMRFLHSACQVLFFQYNSRIFSHLSCDHQHFPRSFCRFGLRENLSGQYVEFLHIPLCPASRFPFHCQLVSAWHVRRHRYATVSDTIGRWH